MISAWVQVPGRTSWTTPPGAEPFVTFKTPESKIFRVDVFVIPLAEISKHVSDKIHLCYYGSSPVPPITVNSGGYERPGGKYYGHNIPFTNYQEYVFINGRELNLDRVPDGRQDPSLTTPHHPQPMPQGSAPSPRKSWPRTG